MNKNLYIALYQYEIEWHDIRANFNKIEGILEGLDNSIDLLLLPEMFNTGFTMQPEIFSEEDCKMVKLWISEISNKYKIACLGSVPEKEGRVYYNRLHYFSPEGNHQVYDKKHLFTMGDETKHYKSGDEIKIVEYKKWKILPLICYDLRFPVWSRNTNYKYDLLIYVANWPALRNLAWEALLKARAIENQCYVIGVNRVGSDGRGIEYIGNSQIISPKGEVLHKLENEEGVLVAKLDIELLERFRRSFPVLDDADEFILK